MPEKLKVIEWSALNPQETVRLLQRPASRSPGLTEAVAEIIGRVRDGGDRAVAELTREFDAVTPAAPVIGEKELGAAAARVDPDLLQAIRDASERIERFHDADRPRDSQLDTAPGLTCEVRYEPLSPVGLYIPGGSAPLVSTVLMLAIPAALAGCEEVVMCSPPGRDGRITDEVLAAARAP